MSRVSSSVVVGHSPVLAGETLSRCMGFLELKHRPPLKFKRELGAPL